MDKIWENEYVYIAACYSVVILCMIVFLTVFELVTKYNNWEEIKRGNLSVAMATGGKIFGIANVFRQSILQNDSILIMIGWGIYGFTLLLIGYFIFEFMTPSFKIDDEIKKDNRAVGFLSMMISIGLSFVIDAGIS
jgi:putative membrane protein